MRVLYLTSWGYSDGISIASARPSIRALAGSGVVNDILYVTLEKQPSEVRNAQADIGTNVVHTPVVQAVEPSIRHLQRHLSYSKIVKQNKCDLVVCRGATVTPYGVAAKKAHGAYLVVESFEPHAEYMVHSGVWSRFGAKYNLQKRWDKVALRQADRVFTVSHGFSAHLASVGIPQTKLATIPCFENDRAFIPNIDIRRQCRNQLGVEGPLCIYAGKFNGIYLKPQQAARVLHALRRSWPRGESVEFLILTPDHCHSIRQALAAEGLSEKVTVITAKPEQVPQYMDASDFAISFHKTSRWSFALSPIKHAEYWAMGLPIICPRGVGDDARLIESLFVGAVADFSSDIQLAAAAKRMCQIITNDNYRSHVRSLLPKLRDRTALLRAYNEMLDDVMQRKFRISQ